MPEETRRVARAAFPKGTLCLRIADALGLALTDPGFDHTVLSEFRTRLVEGGAELLLLDTLLQRLQEQGLVKARGRQRTDSTHVLADRLPGLRSQRGRGKQ